MALMKDVLSRSRAKTDSSPWVSRVRVRGALNVALKERRVLVPNETFASNVSPPPKTFLILLVALCVEEKERGGEEEEEKETTVRQTQRYGGDNVGAHRGTLAISDFGGGLEEETGPLSGRKNDVDVSGLRCGVCGRLQTCVNGLKEVGLDEVVSDVSGRTQNGLEGRKRVRLWEMGIHQGCEERPAGVFCAVDSNGGNASVLVEESGVHVCPRKEIGYVGTRNSEADDIESFGMTVTTN